MSEQLSLPHNPLDDPLPGFVEIGEAPRTIEYMRRLWRFRDFVREAPVSQLHAQNFDTTLGAAWHLLNPLLHAGVYYLIFGVLFDANDRVDNYAAFLVVGIFVFTFTMRSVQSGSTSIIGNFRLIRQINFPRAGLPISILVAETLTHVLALTALLPFLLILGEPLSVRWLLLLPLTLIQALFNLGLILAVARFSYHFRDLQNLLPYILRLWMYVSGLFFTVEFVIDQVGVDSLAVMLFELNPAYVYMHVARSILITNHPAPPAFWYLSIVWAALALIFGFMYFRAREVEYGRG